MSRRCLTSASLIFAAAVRRRRRSLLSLIALALAAGLVTALVTLYRGVQTHLGSGFRNYGANLMIMPANGSTLLAPTLSAPVLSAYPDSAGVLYAVGEANGQAIAIAGADLARLRRLNPEWRLTDRAPDNSPRPREVWIGVQAARLLGVRFGDTVTVRIAGRTETWRLAGTVQSGGSEDNQLLAPYAAVAALAENEGYSTLALRVDAEAMPGAVRRVRAMLPGAEIEPVRQITAGEGAILLGARRLVLTAAGLILLAVGLCVAASLITLAWERRRDFALMKALGAGEGGILLLFVGEAALLGVGAAVVGVAVGAGAASLMGRLLFHLWLQPSAAGVAGGAATAVGLAALTAFSPWPMLRRLTPATILKGEA